MHLLSVYGDNNLINLLPPPKRLLLCSTRRAQPRRFNQFSRLHRRRRNARLSSKSTFLTGILTSVRAFRLRIRIRFSRYLFKNPNAVGEQRVCFGSAEHYLHQLKLHYHIIARCDSDLVTATRNQKQKQYLYCIYTVFDSRVHVTHTNVTIRFVHWLLTIKSFQPETLKYQSRGYRHRFTYGIRNLIKMIEEFRCNATNVIGLKGAQGGLVR